MCTRGERTRESFCCVLSLAIIWTPEAGAVLPGFTLIVRKLTVDDSRYTMSRGPYGTTQTSAAGGGRQALDFRGSKNMPGLGGGPNRFSMNLAEYFMERTQHPVYAASLFSSEPPSLPSLGDLPGKPGGA